MPYWVTLFAKPHNHDKGDYNRDIQRVGPLFPNVLGAEQHLYNIMVKNPYPGRFLRIDWNIAHNPVVYADATPAGWIVRFKSRDGFHWTKAITMQEFRVRLTNRIAAAQRRQR